MSESDRRLDWPVGPTEGVRAILLDIEGTTTPIAFVADGLFGYARAHLHRYIKRHVSSTEFDSLVDRLCRDYEIDCASGDALPVWTDEPTSARIDSIVRYVEWLMDRDRKSSALKELQGRIWDEGYQQGDLIGEVFADVPGALARWHAHGLAVGIFSSGSVHAQQLLFRHSRAGDLTGFLQWFFDTTTGTKTDPESYRRIATAIGIPVAAVLFVSDASHELDAARIAGMQTRLSIRPGNPPLAQTHDHTAIETFDELVVS